MKVSYFLLLFSTFYICATEEVTSEQMACMLSKIIIGRNNDAALKKSLKDIIENKVIKPRQYADLNSTREECLFLLKNRVKSSLQI